MEYTYRHTGSQSIYVPSQEEKFIRKIDYDTPQKSFHLDIELFKKEPHPSARLPSQRPAASIKTRTPAIKTLYVAEKNSFECRKEPNPSISGTRLAKGDYYYQSYRKNFRGTDAKSVKSSVDKASHEPDSGQYSVEASSQSVGSSRLTDSQCLLYHAYPEKKRYSTKEQIIQQCYRYSQNLFFKSRNKQSKHETFNPKKRGKQSSFSVVDRSSDESFESNTTANSPRTRSRRHYTGKKTSPDMDTDLSSSDEKCRGTNMKTTSETARPGCSYIEHYSHVPDTSAFQRFVQQEGELSPTRAHKTSPIEKEHNSEQYGRDFTAFDTISARARRHSASVPLHHRDRCDTHRGAAERMHKIRHKLNPVRDYRLMDTVHYLAQGEFAPRDDGIKLTPSREAVLSDIIWEDVCRTHWPNTRLSCRRHERRAARTELQNLIDNLLRERVAHVERRRRRHYRIVKLNHRRESRTNPLGKTDVIVASHKNRNKNEAEQNLSDSVHLGANSADERQNFGERNGSRKKHKSYDGLSLHEPHGHFRSEDCSPGPSYLSAKCPETFKTTCCYHTYQPDLPQPAPAAAGCAPRNPTDTSSNCRSLATRPDQILVTKRHRPRPRKEETTLNQYILLPTLVMRTPSNLKRQKKFNDLYHRVLRSNSEDESKTVETSEKKSIGLNVHITLSHRNEDVKVVKKKKE